MESLANELDSLTPIPSAHPAKPDSQPGTDEFIGMTQHEAILEALRRYGPQTPQELFARLCAGGCPFKEQSNIYGIIARIRDRLEKTEDRKWKIKEAPAA